MFSPFQTGIFPAEQILEASQFSLVFPPLFVLRAFAFQMFPAGRMAQLSPSPCVGSLLHVGFEDEADILVFCLLGTGWKPPAVW